MTDDAIGARQPDPTALTTQQTLREVGMLKELMETRLESVETRLSEMDKATTLWHDDLVRVPTQVDKAISGLQALVESWRDGDKVTVAGLKEKVDLRQTVIDSATTHLQELIEEKIDGQVAEKITGRVDLLTEKIKSLSDVTTQQFKSIDDRFAEKDKAVSVGLQAQKESAAAQQASNTEATTKMESNFTKLLDQGRELLAEVRRNTELQINDLKTGVSGLAARIDRGEGKTSVSDPAVADGIRQLGTMMADLAKSRDTGTGHAAGISQSTGLMIALGGLAIAAVAIFMRASGLG